MTAYLTDHFNQHEYLKDDDGNLYFHDFVRGGDPIRTKRTGEIVQKGIEAEAEILTGDALEV